jgi:HSP20 family protein
MALVRWQPNHFFSLGRDADRLFDSLWTTGEGHRPRDAWRPSVDIAETEGDYVLTADLPGISKEDLDVTVVDGRLTVKGERRQETESTDENLHRVERAFGTFTRAFDLPTAVDAAGISATYKDGVLTVAVPKAEEAKPKQIDVKVTS